MNLSVCIITKNEALKLKKCLASLKRYDVEIVVVDTGSTDETLQVIEEYADIKGNYKWNDNFAEARNCSITLANNEWILVLDSDEWIESADMNLINSILLQSDSNIVGRIERINDINLSGENVKGTERISRLFNKKYCHYEGRIHEQVVSNNGDEIKTIDVPIIAGHSGYAGSEDDKKRKSERNIKQLAMEALKSVGLEDRMKHKPNEMSGGQQQRVAVARAVAAKPPIILADEPTGNLDTKSTQEIMEILKELHRSGRTVIIITHDEEIASQAHRVIRILDGRIEEDYCNR